MPIEQVVVLALIQGITEFLPISSSGHLILVPALTGWRDQGVLVDVMSHLGSLLAVIVYFWRDVLNLLRGLGDLARRKMSDNARLVAYIALGTIPIVAVGLVLKATGITNQLRSAEIVAWNAIIFGLLMYVADRFGAMKRVMRDLDWKAALAIGVAQAVSLNPGTSRSGITMTAARALGFVRTESARFSFLLSIPAIAAAGLLVVGEAVEQGTPITLDAILTGALTFLVAWATIAVLMRLMKHTGFLPFVIYRVILGVVLLTMIYSGAPLTVVN